MGAADNDRETGQFDSVVKKVRRATQDRRDVSSREFLWRQTSSQVLETIKRCFGDLQDDSLRERSDEGFFPQKFSFEPCFFCLGNFVPDAVTLVETPKSL